MPRKNRQPLERGRQINRQGFAAAVVERGVYAPDQTADNGSGSHIDGVQHLGRIGIAVGQGPEFGEQIGGLQGLDIVQNGDDEGFQLNIGRIVRCVAQFDE